MVGRGSLIMVIGFAMIFGFLNIKILGISSMSIMHVVGYNQSTVSRNAANAGANLGLAYLAKNFNKRGIIKQQAFTTGPFRRCSLVVRMDSIYTNPIAPYLRMRSVAYCTTLAKLGNNYVVLSDTVEVRFDCTTKKSFSALGWMTENEGGVYFITGDTLWGKVHTNSSFNIDGSPVFMGKATCSGGFVPACSTKKKPTTNKAIFKAGYEEGALEKPFPSDISEIISNATNVTSTRTQELWVELKPGTSADDDGYAIIRTGSFTGTRVDSIQLSGDPNSSISNNVIYSNQKVHLKGTLDGRLSVGSLLDVKIEGNTTYERAPNPNLPLTNPVNATTDMLGIIANNNVVISNSYHGNINIHGSVFARTGGFTAENYDTRPIEGRINLIGSIAQNNRGAVGTFSNGSVNHGYLKSYRYDTRMDNPDKPNDPTTYPPSFPGFITPGPLTVTNWWESTRVPFDIDKYN